MRKLLKLAPKWRTYPFLARCITFLYKGIVRALLGTCRWNVQGVDSFVKFAAENKCILIFWHNRLVITPILLYSLVPEFNYAALVSDSRDGDLISAVIHSYANGRTIRVPHHSRYAALSALIRHVRESSDIAVITPDGPRGPVYQVKPGIVVAARETGAYIVPMDWTATRYWEFKTWDKLRIPKPFSRLSIQFGKPIKLDGSAELAECQDFLNQCITQYAK